MIEPAMHDWPANDDHRPADMWRGEMFLDRVYRTLRSNDALWRRTLLIIAYDEHGGLYGHVPPPAAERWDPPQMAIDGMPSGLQPMPQVAYYGLRAPALLVSPWVPAGVGTRMVLDHTAITKTVLARFLGHRKPFLSDRVTASPSLNAFLTESQPRDVSMPLPMIPLRDEDGYIPQFPDADSNVEPEFRPQSNGVWAELTSTNSAGWSQECSAVEWMGNSPPGDPCRDPGVRRATPATPPRHQVR